MRLLWLGLGLAATARAETCAESPFNTDAACKATGRYDILDPQHVAVGCHEEVCTEARAHLGALPATGQQADGA